jgi:hypothetical protein
MLTEGKTPSGIFAVGSGDPLRTLPGGVVGLPQEWKKMSFKFFYCPASGGGEWITVNFASLFYESF